MIRRTFMGISLMSILNLGNSKEISKENKASKALVIYFSRNGMNYWHGETKNLSVGNTARMAKVIQEATSADVWEIQPVHSYPFDYRQTTAEAQKEQEVDARPEIKLSMPDLAQYDLLRAPDLVVGDADGRPNLPRQSRPQWKEDRALLYA